MKDACPDVPGVQSEDAAKNGCPTDKDADGVPDAKDACPDIPGVQSEDAAKNGCPTDDKDNDGIPDAIDSCPDEKGFPNAEAEKHGCPRTVRVTQEEVLLLQQIQFDFDEATIDATSQPVLDEVAQALKDHPEILSVEVQGHTDEKGTKEYNKRLSQRRAEAVQQALIRRGIAADRLNAKGYGNDVPLDESTTDAGRQKNRRVEFKIVQKATRRP
jgi:outer membrane protein OmpA-like peptidoglycan-associated protein